MSKLNTLRIINLSYNKNTIRVNNETFDFGGESTLMSLRNGGGKTVMVQMLLAPFVRRRDLKDRKFVDYFNSNTPTYIMTEWMLDNDSGYVLIGMAVRKRPLNADEEAKPDLDIITFIHEYKSGNDYDIHNIPVISRSSSGMKLMPMSEVRKMMEDIRNSRRFAFDYYDLSADYQRKRYGERLKEYNINQKEWEGIIQKINMKESGLSELFSKAKTVPSLVNEWFLPAIEDKLNDNGNRLRSFQQILNKYIVQLKENESKLELKDGIEEFGEFSDRVLHSAEELESVLKNIHKTENDIANLYAYIKATEDKQEKELKRLEDLQALLGTGLEEIEYERLSYDYYSIIEEIQVHETEVQRIREELNRLTDDKEALMREFGCLECAGLYSEYIASSGDILELENKLANAEKDEDERQKCLKDTGYTLNIAYAEKLREISAQSESMQGRIQSVQRDLEQLKNRLEEENEKQKDCLKDITKLEERILSFEKKEEQYRSRYKEFTLFRNILGEYDGQPLKTYEEKLGSRNLKNRNMLEECISKKSETENNIEQMQDTLIDINNKRNWNENEQKDKNSQLKVIIDKCEKMKNILMYSGIDEERLFDKEYIVETIRRQIDMLGQERNDIQREADRLKHLLEMYESGKNIKLPEEFEKKLDELDIPVLYGLMWLKKQRLTTEKKLELIRNNPFLPYSIIMGSSRIEMLKGEQLDIFTSLPIPIVEREKLDQAMTVKVTNNLYSMQNMSFYISFNEKLLNEDELKAIVDDLKKKINRNKEDMKIKSDEIEKFSTDLAYVRSFNITRKDIISLKESIHGLEKAGTELKRDEENITNDINTLKRDLKEYTAEIESLKEIQRHLEKESEDFAELRTSYEQYRMNKSKEKLISDGMNTIKANMEEIKLDIKREENTLDGLKSEFSVLRNNQDNIKYKQQEYLSFNEGRVVLGDLVDLEAEYKALKEKMGLTVKEYNDLLGKENKRLKDTEEKLESIQKEYMLSEDDFKYVFYDKVKQEDIKKNINSAKKDIKNVEGLKRAEEDSKLELEVKKNNQLDKIRENVNKEAPIDRELIVNTDFLGRRKEKENELKSCKSDVRQACDKLEILKSNMHKLDNYKEFEVVEIQELDISYNKLDGARETVANQYMSYKSEEDEKRDILIDMCNSLASQFKYSSIDYFKNTIDLLQEIKHKPEEIRLTLQTVRDVHERTMLQLQSDLAKIEEERNTIITLLLDYVEEMHNHMGRIDDNSSLNIGGRSYKMLNIDQPEWQEEINILKLKDYIDRVVEECKNYLSDGKSIDDVLSKEITSSKLYDHIVGIGNIEIKLHKIETSRIVRISWNEVAKNSGGEGFVSAFIIMVCLLSYMRREEDLITNAKEEGKVLIMDNPFAQTNAEHLLKPLIDIAKKYNTQLICFTGLGGDSIYNRFDNIYVLTLLDSKLHQGVQIMESEHKKGEELTQMTSSRFLTKNEKYEQITLF